VVLVRDGGVNPQILQQAPESADIAHARDVVQNHTLARQQGRRHCWQRSILGPADRHRAL